MGLKGMFVLAADGPETMEAPADSSTEIAGTASGNSLYSVLESYTISGGIISLTTQTQDVGVWRRGGLGYE